MEKFQNKIKYSNLLKNHGLIFLVIVLIVTTLSVFLIHQFNFERSLYRFTVALPGVLALLFIGLNKKTDTFNYSTFLKQFSHKETGNEILRLKIEY